MSSVNSSIYAGELKLNKSILSWFTGDEYQCIDNKWFKPPRGVKSIDPKKWMVLQDVTAGKNVAGNPMLYLRTDLKEAFKSSPEIGYAKRHGESKEYRISSYEIEKLPTDKRNVTISISPNGTEFSLDDADENLITLNYQMHVVIDVLMISTLFNLNLQEIMTKVDKSAFVKKYGEDFNATNNKHFIVCLLDNVKGFLQRADGGFKIPDIPYPTYIIDNWYGYTDRSFRFIKNANKNMIIEPDLDGGDRYTLFGYVKAISITSAKPKKWFTNKIFNDILTTSNHYSVPAVYVTSYTDKNDVEKTALQARYLISLCSPSEAETGKDTWRYTQEMKRGQDGKIKTTSMTRVDLFEFMNVSQNAKSVVKTGCVYIKPRFYIGFYGLGNTRPQMMISRIAVRAAQTVTNYTPDGAEFLMYDADEPPKVVEEDTRKGEEVMRRSEDENPMFDEFADEI
jgi:hypothetical protein